MGYRANNFEGQPNGTTLTAANSASGSGEAFQTILTTGTATVKYDTSTFAHGSTCMKITVPAASTAHVRWEGLGRSSSQYGRGYFMFPSLPATATTFVQFSVVGPTQVALIRIDTSGHIRLTEPTGVNGPTSVSTITPGTWFRLEWHVSSSSQAELRIFLNADDAAASEILAASAGTNGSPTMVQFASDNVFTQYVDCVEADAPTWPGPWRRLVGMQIPAQHPYILHEDYRTVTAANPQRYFTVSATYGIGFCRSFISYDQIFNMWLADPVSVMNDIERMCNDADANDVKLILGPLLNGNAINALAGSPYPSEGAAGVALTTNGSAPWNTLMAWQADLAARIGSHNGVLSLEVGNELAWLLDFVDTDTYLAFLDFFQSHLKSHGAKATNTGGKIASNFNALSDAQILVYTAHLDYIDNHQYASDINYGTAREAAGAIAAFEPFVARVRTLTSKPGYPVVYGEVGSLPEVYFETIAQLINANEWIGSYWVFDGDQGDSYGFNDISMRTDVLPFLQTVPDLGPIPNLTRTNTFDGGSSGVAITGGSTGNSGGASGDYFDSVIIDGTATVTFDAHSKIHGPLSMRIGVPAASSVHVRWEALLETTSQYGRGYFMFPTLPSGTATFMQFTQQGIAQVAFIRLDATGHVILSDPDGGNAVTATTALRAGHWFRLEWHVSSTQQAQVRVYANADSTTISDTLAGTASTSGVLDMVQFMMGDVATYNVDEVVSDALTWPGPASSTDPGGGGYALPMGDAFFQRYKPTLRRQKMRA